MRAVGRVVQEPHPRHAANRLHQCVDNLRTPPLADVGHALDEGHGQPCTTAQSFSRASCFEFRVWSDLVAGASPRRDTDFKDPGTKLAPGTEHEAPATVIR